MGEDVLAPLALIALLLAACFWTCWGAYWWMLRPIIRWLDGKRDPK